MAPETLTESDLDRLLYFLKTDRNYESTPRIRARNYLAASLMADSGLRVSEVVNLKPNQLFAQDPHVTQPHHGVVTAFEGVHLPASSTKTSTARTVPFTDRLRMAIGHYFRIMYEIGQYPYPLYVFPGRGQDTHITTRQVHRILERAGRLVLHRPVHPHILRHTFATRIVRVASTSVAQQLLGHQSLSSTQVYLHPNSDDLTTAVKSLNKQCP